MYFWIGQQTLSLLPLNCPCRTLEVNNTWNDSQQPITFIVFYVLTLYWKGKVRSNLRSMVITPRAQWGNKSVWQTRNWTGQLIVSSDLTLSREHVPGMKEKNKRCVAERKRPQLKDFHNSPVLNRAAENKKAQWEQNHNWFITINLDPYLRV